MISTKFAADSFMPQDEDRVRRVLTKGTGIQILSPFEAQLRVGRRLAKVLVEPDQSLRVSIQADSDISVLEALEFNYSLPGNLRFAAAAGPMVLIADSQIDGELHLARSFAEIRQGLVRALDGRPRRPRGRNRRPLQHEQVAEAIDGCGWGQDTLVRLEDRRWEVRRPVGGRTSAVEISVIEDRLNFEETVLSDPMPEIARLVVARQALRFNHHLRHARLAIAKDGLVAQACLHCGLVQPRWIAAATSAVAVASRHVQGVLRVLAEQEDVANLYRTVFP